MRFLLVGLSILGVMYGYIGLRIVPHLGLTARRRKVAWGVLVLLLIIPLLPIFLQVRGNETALAENLAWLSYLTLGFITLLLPILIVRDTIWFLSWGGLQVWKLVQKWRHAGSPSPPVDDGRRQFLIHTMNVGLLAVTGGLCSYARSPPSGRNSPTRFV